MAAGTNYDPAHTHFPMAEKATATLLFAFSAAHDWPIEHLEISNEYVYEPAMYVIAIFFREMARRDGKYDHGRTIRRIFKNLWGGKSADPYFIQALFQYITQNGFQQSYMDSFLAIRRTNKGIIRAAITVDDFLAVESATEFTEQLASFL